MNKIVLCIGAHPDDIELGAGGLITKLEKNGAKLHFILATNGENGSISTSLDNLAKIRYEEAKNASNYFNVASLKCLDLPDGLVSYTLNNKIDLIRKMRELKSEIVITHSSLDSFSDHKIVHELSMSAINMASRPFFSEAGREIHETPLVLGYEVSSPMPNFQCAVNISDEIENKIIALKSHKSQLNNIQYEDSARSLARYRGVTTGAGEYVEVFEILKNNMALDKWF